MSTQLKDLIDEQNTVWKRMCDIRDTAAAEKRTMTAEELTNWDQAEARLSEVSSSIERLQRMASLDVVDRSGQVTATGQPGAAGGGNETQVRYGAAFGAYLRRGIEQLPSEQRDLLEGNHVDLRAQGGATDPAGGYLVPETFRNILIETMKVYGGLLGQVEVITTSTGADLRWPTNDDTGNEGEILAENQQVSEQDVTLGGKTLKAHIFSSKMIRVSRALLQDSAFDLDAWLPRKLGERIGRRAARAWATGTGVDEPQGITVGSTVGKTGATGQTTSIIYNDLIDLEHSVDPAYRGQASYVLHDQLLKVIRKLVDGQSRPLWVPIPAPGFPATINGFPYVVDNSMPVPAANAKSLVFGDLRAGYIVRQVLGVQVLRLIERYAEFLQVGFLGFSRMDGSIQDPAAIRAYAHSAT